MYVKNKMNELLVFFLDQNKDNPSSSGGGGDGGGGSSSSSGKSKANLCLPLNICLKHIFQRQIQRVSNCWNVEY